MRPRAPLLTVLLLITLSTMTCDAGQTEWGYSGPAGPEYWGNLSDEYKLCSGGVEQSPIDISGYETSDGPAIAFEYGGRAVSARNTGHTVYLDFEQGNAISIEDRQYQLLGVHSHSPGEHRVDGESFAAELHLVHEDAEGNLAVIGLLFRLGEPSPLVQALLDTAPETGATAQLGSGVDAADFVPDQLDYYGYGGSLTTPPCTEGVQWIVMRSIGTVSAEQVGRLQSLTHGPNNRPPQPHRPVARSSPSTSGNPAARRGTANGAGDGNRTHVASLEGWDFTTKLRPLSAIIIPHRPERPPALEPPKNRRF